MPYNANKKEKEILEFWEKNKCFEKSVEARPEEKSYVFYDGPPFATGLPHYGHIVASLMKDVVPRYWTMRGHRVERVWGWDCHGLPIENIVEKELGTKSKKEIEEDIGVEKFNELCRSKVLSYVDEWKKTIYRFGRWVDMENAYKTMDKGYMESVWWVFKQLWDKGLIYEGYSSMHICPRCETTLSQQEVSEGYKTIKDLSVVAKFKLKETGLKKEKIGESETFILAWTTTPWTLPGNVALAVGEKIQYVLAVDKEDDVRYILAKELLEKVLKDKEYEIEKEFTGSDLAGLDYEPLFVYFDDEKLDNRENGFKVYTGDFVSTEEGTGVVHIAPAFGEDDMNLGKEKELPFVQHVTTDGKFTKDVEGFAGRYVKPIENPQETDIEIIKYLSGKELLFAKEKYEHNYPHCWRCDTPLINYATSSWFVKVTEIKADAINLAKNINWSPGHVKEGRFGKWLAGARDWSVSRQRFWASVMPVWHCSDCDSHTVFGSVSELEEASGQSIDDLHKHIVDNITLPCECGQTMKRIPDVLDTWFDSGSMPYAQMHYPFENKEKFEANFPAEFIAEGQDQTRAWFYYLHVIASAIKQKHAFDNVIVNGIVLAEDGKKMSKKLQNYPDPMDVLSKYGADALRFYLVTSPVMHAESLNFSEEGVREMYNKVVNTLWNVFSFYSIFAGGKALVSKKSDNVLDVWIMSKLNILVREVTKEMNEYRLAEASRPILDFVTELSQWYVRRSRDRFKGTDEEDKKKALTTLHEVLLVLSKVMAPFTPFIAEQIYQELKKNVDEQTNFEDSVHLEKWPEAQDKIDDKILSDMIKVRKIVELGLFARKDAGIRVRQPLAELSTDAKDLSVELFGIIQEEMNVKIADDNFREGDGWVTKEDSGIKVSINTVLTPELEKEGLFREVVRAINQKRKEQKLTVEDMVVVELSTDDEVLDSVFNDYEDELKTSVLASEIRSGGEEEIEVSGRKMKLGLYK